ncbi:DUF4179 domain-containing protein [Paenibacillus sp. MABNR03]|uniref:DUF4179 domain-containing protein n=1 Tax=Paenibacillus sp. MABNR03 TaxID=3142626 RepID=UPI003D27D71E
METSPEEKALLADAYQVELEKQQLNPADTAFAIQRGLAIARARRTTSGVQIKWLTAVLITAMAAGWFLLGPYRGGFAPQTTAVEPIQDWGVLEPFRDLAAKDVDGETLVSAINNGYFQLVDRTVKSGIYQFTVNAVMADENRLIVLYTAKTDDSQEIYSVVNTKMTNALTGKLIDNGNSGGLHTSNDNHTIYGRSTIELTQKQPLPEQVMINLQISSVVPNQGTDSDAVKKERKYQFSKKMNITFNLDSKFSVPHTEVLELNKLFTVGGYEVLLSEVVLSPLVTRARFIYEPEKEIDYETRLLISDAVNPIKIVSSTKDGKQTELSLVGGNGTEDGMIYSFSSNLLDDPQSLVMKLRGEPGKVYDDLQEAERNMIKLKIK